MNIDVEIDATDMVDKLITFLEMADRQIRGLRHVARLQQNNQLDSVLARGCAKDSDLYGRWTELLKPYLAQTSPIQILDQLKFARESVRLASGLDYVLIDRSKFISAHYNVWQLLQGFEPTTEVTES